MAYSPIDKPNTHFNPVIYSGNDVDGRAITTGFQTDWTWVKRRNATNSHIISDIVRGATYKLDSSETTAQVNNYDGGHLESFTSTGFTLGAGGINSGHTNATGGTYVSWNWKAGGTASSNTDGSITSTVSANPTAGFSIVKYSGNSTTGATVGHGLSTAPKMIIIKSLGVENWEVYHESLGNTKGIYLNTTGASFTTSARWNNTSPTSSVWTMGSTTAVNGSGIDYVAYCFSDVKGYQKSGSYIGNGQDTPNGVFTYLGFTPAFILIKATDINSWVMVDNKRPADSNPVDDSLAADSSAAETTGNADTTFDFLSNGFRTNGNSGNNNSSGQEYIYYAVAQNPLVASNYVPTTAR